MRDVGRDLWEWLSNGAHVYVCGDALRMAKDVERALIDVVAEHGKRSPEDAARYVAELKKNDRYQQESTRGCRRGNHSHACRSPAGKMAPLTRLPVFLALEGKRAVLAGGSAAAAWKAELLSAAGARVAVYAEGFDELCKSPTTRRAARLRWRRGWAADDLKGAAVAIGAFDDDGARPFRRRRARCRRAGQCDRQAGLLRFFLRRHCRRRPW